MEHARSTSDGHLVERDVLRLGDIAENGDDRAREDGRERVDDHDDVLVAVDVVAELVERGHRDDRAGRHARRVEHLRRRRSPNLRGERFVHARFVVVDVNLCCPLHVRIGCTRRTLGCMSCSKSGLKRFKYEY